MLVNFNEQQYIQHVCVINTNVVKYGFFYVVKNVAKCQIAKIYTTYMDNKYNGCYIRCCVCKSAYLKSLLH